MITKIQRWGNSLGLRIPKALAEDLQVGEDAAVDLSTKNGCLVVAPVRQEAYDLDELLSQITPKNVHGEVDFGQPMGREAL